MNMSISPPQKNFPPAFKAVMKMLNEIRPVRIYASMVNSFSQKILLLSKYNPPLSRDWPLPCKLLPHAQFLEGCLRERERVHVCVCVCVCGVTVSCS